MHRKGPNMRCHVRAFFAGFSIIFQNRSARQWMTPLLIGTVSYWQYKIEQADLSLKEIITMSFSYSESRLPPLLPNPLSVHFLPALLGRNDVCPRSHRPTRPAGSGRSSTRLARRHRTAGATGTPRRSRNQCQRPYCLWRALQCRDTAGIFHSGGHSNSRSA